MACFLGLLQEEKGKDCPNHVTISSKKLKTLRKEYTSLYLKLVFIMPPHASLILFHWSSTRFFLFVHRRRWDLNSSHLKAYTLNKSTFCLLIKYQQRLCKKSRAIWNVLPHFDANLLRTSSSDRTRCLIRYLSFAFSEVSCSTCLCPWNQTKIRSLVTFNAIIWKGEKD